MKFGLLFVSSCLLVSATAQIRGNASTRRHRLAENDSKFVDLTADISESEMKRIKQRYLQHGLLPLAHKEGMRISSEREQEPKEAPSPELMVPLAESPEDMSMSMSMSMEGRIGDLDHDHDHDRDHDHDHEDKEGPGPGKKKEDCRRCSYVDEHEHEHEHEHVRHVQS